MPKNIGKIAASLADSLLATTILSLHIYPLSPFAFSNTAGM